MATTLNIQTVASLLLLGIYGYWHQNSFLKIKEWKYPDMEQIRKSIVVLLKTQENIRYYLPAIPQLSWGMGFYQFTFYFLLILIILQYLLQKATAVQPPGLRLILLRLSYLISPPASYLAWSLWLSSILLLLFFQIFPQQISVLADSYSLQNRYPAPSL